LDAAEKLSIAAKSHSSSISDSEAGKIRNLLGKGASPSKPAATPAKPAPGKSILSVKKSVTFYARRNSSGCCRETSGSGSTGSKQACSTVGEGCCPTVTARWIEHRIDHCAHVGHICPEQTGSAPSAPNGDNLSASTSCVPKSPCAIETPGSS
jgi:hypothetical protein